MRHLAIVNYGMGNLTSVFNAFSTFPVSVHIASSAREVQDADYIVLPGVGAFGDAMKNLNSLGWTEVLNEEVQKNKKPFLGICLGMQVLATLGTEHGSCEGLNWIPGRVTKIEAKDPAIRIPHIGWNYVSFQGKSKLYQGMANNRAFYFVHSYAMRLDEQRDASGLCTYGEVFAASVERENIFATQYHPEKSQTAGLTVLRNFLNAN